MNVINLFILCLCVQQIHHRLRLAHRFMCEILSSEVSTINFSHRSQVNDLHTMCVIS